jgi:RimJ/RimL family protein N-acetyltransferase
MSALRCRDRSVATGLTASLRRRGRQDETVPHLDKITWPARTARLLLRPAASADADITWEYRKLDDVSRWITRAPTTIEDYRAQFLEADRLMATLVVEHVGVVVGDLMLRVQDAWAQFEVAERARGVEAELGWVLDPAYAGRGLATEAVEEMFRLSFEELGLRRVIANCFAGNDASWRLMERVGMRRETHTVRESLHRSGEWLDGYTYALLADEWRLRRS